MCAGKLMGGLSPVLGSKTGKAAMLGGIAGTMLAGKKKKPRDPMQPNLPTTNMGG